MENMNTVNAWYLIKHTHFPIIDIDCVKIIKDIYNMIWLDRHRVLYHNHIYKWMDGYKPNSDLCNLYRNRIIEKWYDIDIESDGHHIWNDKVGGSWSKHYILMVFNYDIRFNEPSLYKYKRMYKKDII